MFATFRETLLGLQVFKEMFAESKKEFARNCQRLSFTPCSAQRVGSQRFSQFCFEAAHYVSRVLWAQRTSLRFF